MDTLGDAEIVVIGGGGVGCGVVHSLCQAGKTEVLLLEKNEALATETTSQAAGLVGQVRTSVDRVKLAMWSVKTFSAARGRVRAGDVVALVDGVAVPQARDAAGWAAFVQGLKEGPRPLSVAFGRPPKEPAAAATAARKTRPRAKRARDDEYDDNESDEELQAALQASRRDTGPAPVISPPR